jgi:hypothetical protein
MTIRFNREDALICNSCFIEKPSFRLISLELVPGKDGGLVSTCMSTFLCDECLKPEMDDFHRSLNKPKFLLGKEKPRMSFSIVKSAFWLSPFP